MPIAAVLTVVLHSVSTLGHSASSVNFRDVVVAS